MKTTPLISVEKLQMTVGDTLLVKGISFTLEAHKITALVGASGSGKSLTAQSLLGIQSPKIKVASKKMEFQGIPLPGDNTNAWEQLRGYSMGMIFQEPQSSLNPSMRCGQQVLEALLIHQTISKQAAKTKVLQAFEDVQLPQPERIYNAYPHEISGGQKQRVMIALALINTPDLLIADEPTTALDVTVQKEIVLLLKQLQQKHQMGILFISHDLALVQHFADTVMVMQEGEIVEQGAVKNVFSSPQHPYTKGLIHARPPVDKRPKRLATIADYMANTVNEKWITKKEREQKHQHLYQQTPLLQVEALRKVYSRKRLFWQKPESFTAVHPLHFEIYPGETLGLVGESGCGKSTLARALVYLDPPTEGNVFFENRALHHMSAKALMRERKNIQYIFQDPYAALHPQKTLGKSIAEVLRHHKITQGEQQTQERVTALLDRVGLSAAFAPRYPHELSGGQRQRAVIARALATHPRLIICDEAVAALDISVQAQVINLLKDLQQEFQLAYLFISHDLTLVKYVSDRVMVMHNGSVEELQEADQLYSEPKSNYTKKLIAARPS